MKNKVIVLIIASILTVGGISVAYATNRNDVIANNFNRQLMGTQNNNRSYNSGSSMMGDQNVGEKSKNGYNDMIKIMKNNGFSDEAKAMENGDFDTMNNFMNNISDDDYKKMIDIMGENGYESMSNMMRSINKEDMTGIHGSMMGR
ncbi:hypothetical protein [Clostridium sp.]